jgi:acyl dehydratase
MPVSTRYVLHQGPVLGALARAAFTSMRAARSPEGASRPSTPGSELRAGVTAPPADLVRDYVRHAGGDPGAYRGVIPPHLFPQWVFPVASRTLEGLPYPLSRMLNAGCRLEINAPLPAGERLEVSARLESIDDNGHRAILHQRAVTSTPAHPEAVVAHLYTLVPLGKGGKKAAGSAGAKERPRVPEGATELARWRLPAGAGLDFAKLTGDFNPVHWVPPYARAFGFRSVILHGFATMVRAMEGLTRALFAGDTSAIRVFDVRFTRPLLLPHRVGLYVHDKNRVYVGDAPGGPAYLTGSFESRASGARELPMTNRESPQ